MATEIPADLPPALVPLAWLIGTWQGAGVGGYPTIPEFRFGQEIRFSALGVPALRYESVSWHLDDQGRIGERITEESGYWRPAPDGSIEVLLAHPTGYSEVWLGTVEAAKIEIRTDVVARTETAKPYTAGHRLYGSVAGDLLWAFDMAAGGHPLAPHVSARLRRAAAT